MKSTEAELHVLSALTEVHQLYRELGTSGAERTEQKNRYGDNSLIFDVRAEEEIVAYFRRSLVAARVHGEELGASLTTGSNPQLTVIMDGLDGSGTMAKQFGTGPYGTMLAILEGNYPCYDDYLACGIIHHASGRLFIASQGNGAAVEAILKPQRDPRLIRTAGTRHLAEAKLIYVDEFWETNRQVFSPPLFGFPTQCLMCSCIYYSTLAEGKADLVCECTRKGNLEIAVAYGLVTEAGGVMVDINGESLGPKKYLEFGQGKDEFLPVITAATPELAAELIALLTLSKR